MSFLQRERRKQTHLNVEMKIYKCMRFPDTPPSLSCLIPPPLLSALCLLLPLLFSLRLSLTPFVKPLPLFLALLSVSLFRRLSCSAVALLTHGSLQLFMSLFKVHFVLFARVSFMIEAKQTDFFPSFFRGEIHKCQYGYLCNFMVYEHSKTVSTQITFTV